MKKLVAGVAVVALLLAAGVAMAVPSGQAGKSNTAHLYLFEKDPATWLL